MSNPIPSDAATSRFLVADGEPAADRAARRASVGESAGESYARTLAGLADATITIATPADVDADAPGPRGFDAVFLTGSPLHLYRRTPAVERQVQFMRAVFASGVPSFGSCAGLQLATVAAGGSVRPVAGPREAGFARRIWPTDAGRAHPLLAGRPPAFDAPAIHGDEVEALPAGATLLASNGRTTVQAAEIRHDRGIFWGVQYHPELSLTEIAAALRRDADTLIDEAIVPDLATVEVQAGLIEALGRDPARLDLRWRLGVDAEVADEHRRRTELRNFLAHLRR